MTDMQRYSLALPSWSCEAYMNDDPDGVYVLASDAEAAIAAAHHSAFAFGIKCAHKGRKRGEQDMLAKCITLIEESVPWSTENWVAVNERAAILADLRALRDQS